MDGLLMVLFDALLRLVLGGLSVLVFGAQLLLELSTHSTQICT
jgi:hypothetical protein